MRWMPDRWDNTMRNSLYICPALRRLSDLCNALAHPHPDWSLHEYDKMLCVAQKIAVVLDDEPRAAEMRALRDQFRDEAETTWAEIQRLSSYEHKLPPGKEWKPHHERLFVSFIRWDRVTGDPAAKTGIPEDLRAAVARWLSQEEDNSWV
ncbi:hypothetical protein B0H63DRAFT_524850 [Podospora didyma]|uniref:Uncharacterized protein n=1 Tax=Podospora didyma TaxID=330526 RepID=A0AAE0NB72_9PEZI|nr:hypothetical protein B0H63DRAFT_524850 [Podospora didyma]